MTTESNGDATAEGVEQTNGAESNTQEAAAQEGEINWESIESAIDKATPEQLKKFRRFQGILGSELHRSRQVWEQDQKAQTERQAREQAERELEDMARMRPVEFAEKYLDDKAAGRIQKQLETVKASTAQEYMHQIGTAFGQEFNLTQEEIEEISKALAGKQNEEVLPAFNVAAAKVVTQREAKRLFEEWRTKELPKERDALKQEVAADMLKKDTAPGVAKSRPPSTLKPHQLPDDKFDEWYDKNVLRRARYS